MLQEVNGIFYLLNLVLVGGHCIGVDPYYLTYKAENIGYYPKIILAGREINDEYGKLCSFSELINRNEKKKY